VTQDDDLSIISRILLGQVQAYELIVQRYEIRIRDYCQRFLGDREHAEDAAQETFVKAFQALKRFKPDAKFSTWLFRIARNQCLDQLRRQKVRSETSLSTNATKEHLTIESLQASESNQFDTLAARELLDKAFEALPENYREILILREVQGFSYAELAEITESTVDSVKARLKRARIDVDEILRHILAGSTFK
jgi:RNA polymerase sigma-70 factor (ECF subfamily)